MRIHLALGELCRMAPDVDLTVETLTTRELIRALLDRPLHVAIKGVYERVASLSAVFNNALPRSAEVLVELLAAEPASPGWWAP